MTRVEERRTLPTCCRYLEVLPRGFVNCLYMKYTAYFLFLVLYIICICTRAHNARRASTSRAQLRPARLYLDRAPFVKEPSYGESTVLSMDCLNPRFAPFGLRDPRNELTIHGLLCEAWIHALRSSIHGLSEYTLCAQHIHAGACTCVHTVNS